jgi:molybdenum cofactor cytidylyltransferase
MPRTGLIILAAGSSTRMGRPKQLLPWGGTSLLRHACETALQSACSPIIVVLGCDPESCCAAMEGLSVTIVINESWPKGLGTSIAVGIRKLEEDAPGVDGVLIMLADQPTVTPSLLGALINNWSPPVHPIVATLYGEEGGVPALFDRSFFPELRRLEQDRGARALIAREKERTLLINPRANLIDLDTPEAYRRHQPL